ncbi:MAG: hypothetical protein AAF517_21255, partial [Planctomycetota bacterium]
MLIACSSCHRQFDVSGMKSGEHIRCLCGDLVEVREKPAHVAQIRHCSSCGGSLKGKVSSCEYCGCEVTLEERNLGAACPECYARL